MALVFAASAGQTSGQQHFKFALTRSTCCCARFCALERSSPLSILHTLGRCFEWCIEWPTDRFACLIYSAVNNVELVSVVVHFRSTMHARVTSCITSLFARHKGSRYLGFRPPVPGQGACYSTASSLAATEDESCREVPMKKVDWPIEYILVQVRLLGLRRCTYCYTQTAKPATETGEEKTNQPATSLPERVCLEGTQEQQAY